MTTAPDNERRPRHGGNGKRGRKRSRRPAGVRPEAGTPLRWNKPAIFIERKCLFAGARAPVESSKRSVLTFGPYWQKAPHLEGMGASQTFRGDIDGPPEPGQNLRSQTGIEFFFFFCLCWMHFYFRLALFLFAFKKAIHYIVHRPPIG